MRKDDENKAIWAIRTIWPDTHCAKNYATECNDKRFARFVRRSIWPHSKHDDDAHDGDDDDDDEGNDDGVDEAMRSVATDGGPKNIHRTFCGDICALWFCNYL